jgi:ATP-dependent Clp protease protease subunit
MKLLILLTLLTTNVFAKNLVLTSENTASLLGPVDDQSISELILELNSISKEGKKEDPIFLVLNTPGGSVFAGLELMQYVNTLRRPVHVIANYAASMGFHILQNSPKRYVTKFATIMSHRAHSGFRGDIPHQVNSRLNHIISLVTMMDDQVISRTGGKYTRESYMELIRDEYYAVGANAITDGFADEVVTLECDESLNTFKTITVNVAFFSMEAVVSKCPLITMPVAKKQEDTKKVQEYFSMRRILN